MEHFKQTAHRRKHTSVDAENGGRIEVEIGGETLLDEY